MVHVCTPAVASDKGFRVGALVLDDSGVVVGCSATAAAILAKSVASVEGAAISSLIADFMPGKASRGSRIRYLASMSGSRTWRRCNAIDVGGQSIAMEVRLSNISLNGRHIGFLMNLRPFRAPDSSAGEG